MPIEKERIRSTRYERRFSIKYGVSLDTLIYGEKEKQSPVSQGEQLMRGLDRMPQVVQDYCLRMLWLFADGLRAAQEETAEYETVKSSSDSEENSGSED